MANYKISMTVDGVRLSAVTKKAQEAFGKDVQVEKVEHATSRADRFSEAQSLASDAKSIAEELRDELQNWYDNLPENLQSGTKADELQSAIDELESFVSNLDEAENASVDFPGMY